MFECYLESDKRETRMYLVLFDIDGTLLHSAGCGRAATLRAMQDIFGTTGYMDGVRFDGRTDWGVLAAALEPEGVSHAQIAAQMDTYNHTVTHHLQAIIGDYAVRPCTGAPQVVNALKARPDVLLGLVTGNVPGLVPVKLRAAGYDPADFRTGAYGSEAAERSTLPPLALARAEKLAGHRFAPHEMVIIGDTPGDVACARSIQARTIAVATGFFDLDALRTTGADHVFATLDDLDAVLAAILNGS